jgi:hypothetical protein
VTERACPTCEARVDGTAKTCRFCRARLEPRPARVEEPPAEPPGVMKLWGALVMIVNALLLCLQVVRLAGSHPVEIGFVVAVHAVLIRLGWGLWRGRRIAVMGMGILFALAMAYGVAVLTSDPLGGAIFLGVMLVLFGPPIAAGVGAWDRLR